MATERKIRHHTVPKFFLRNWAYDDQVDAIDKATGQLLPMAVANASVVKNFHTPAGLEKLTNPAFMEDDLSRFEASVAHVIKGLPAAVWPPDPKQRAATVDFVTMLWVRSPRMRGIIAEDGSPVEWSASSADDPVTRALRNLGRANEGMGDGGIAYTHVTQMPQLFTVIRPHIARATWLRLDFEDPVLVTGDSPVSFATEFRRPEWFGDQIVDAFALALSPTCALVLRLQDERRAGSEHNDRRTMGNADDAAILNGWTMEFAERWVFKYSYAVATVGRVDGQMKRSTTIRTQGNDAVEGVVRWAHRTGAAPNEALDEYYGGALNHGNKRKDDGDSDGARDAYTHATRSDDQEVAAAAHLSLAVLEHELGNAQAAHHHYSRALAGTGEIHSLASFQLGLLHQDQGDFGAARSAYKLAIDTGHPVFSALAAFNLGHLELQHGTIKAAMRALRQAATAADPQVHDLARTAQARLDSLVPPDNGHSD